MEYLGWSTLYEGLNNSASASVSLSSVSTTFILSASSALYTASFCLRSCRFHKQIPPIKVKTKNRTNRIITVISVEPSGASVSIQVDESPLVKALHSIVDSSQQYS